MVERLKIAIEKARQQREQQVGAAGAVAPPAETASAPASLSAPDAALWGRIEEISLDPEVLTRNRVVSHQRADPTFLVFDMLRTRVMKVCQDNGWRRVGITSPSKGCGKTLISTNLAFSIARQSEARVALLDLDLRVPNVHHTLGVIDAPALPPFLKGEAAPEMILRRIGSNFALAMNGAHIRGSSELLQSSTARSSILNVLDALQTDIALFDLPPMLAGDDVLGFLPNLDCVMVVIGAGQTSAADVAECERLIENNTAFLGLVLNKCTEGLPDPYSYDYGPK